MRGMEDLPGLSGQRGSSRMTATVKREANSGGLHRHLLLRLDFLALLLLAGVDVVLEQLHHPAADDELDQAREEAVEPDEQFAAGRQRDLVLALLDGP